MKPERSHPAPRKILAFGHSLPRILPVNGTPSSQSNRWRILACVFLVLATLVVYRPARHYKFVAYDDDNYVYDN
jgi:hypothetical protein